MLVDCVGYSSTVKMEAVQNVGSASTGLHGIVSKKRVFFMVSAVRMSGPYRR